jgi:exodeoxyribonuclease VII large subunit
LHDVATALRRRLPHVPVLLAPAAVQGAQAPAELIAALQSLYARAQTGQIDVILLVRGGGSLEDLWAFNDEALAHAIVRSPVPLVCGVGHETDFTLADFCADLRAPTPTAAAELVAPAREAWLAQLDTLQERLRRAAGRRLDGAGQRLDAAAARLGRPSARLSGQHQRLERQTQRLRYAVLARLARERAALQVATATLRRAPPARISLHAQRLERASLRLSGLDPRRVLERGYALLTQADGTVLTRTAQARPGQPVQARLADGRVDLTVLTSTPD